MFIPGTSENGTSSQCFPSVFSNSLIVRGTERHLEEEINTELDQWRSVAVSKTNDAF